MSAIPIRYVNPVWRPPSEAHSLILPVTDGCSWNQCSFCEMYAQKKFRARDEAEILGNIQYAAQLYGENVRRIFFADGDAMVLSSRKLLLILNAIKEKMPWIQRVSAYCLPRNVQKKSTEELTTLQQAGLKMVYVGAESGDDEVLANIKKGETFLSTQDALNKLKQAHITRSVMILNGLGGKILSQQHAQHSAQLMNAVQPEFLSVLVTSFPQGFKRIEQDFPQFQMREKEELLNEMAEFIAALNLEKTIFRSDHASNYLVLKGVLNQDKEKLLHSIQLAQKNTSLLRQEWMRGI